jgi:hypothetical protein
MPTSAEVLARQERQAAATRALTTSPQAPLPAVPDNRSALSQYLDEIAPASISGQILKFSGKTGKFVAGDTPIDESVGFIALVDQTMVGWIKFNDDAPPERVMGLLYEGFVMPPRESLGDMDPAEWPTGLDRQPADPWQHQMYLVLQHGDTSELYTFVTSSSTGRRAVGNLLRHYKRMQRTNPGELPVVKLKAGGFNHRDERIGWVPTPTFAVVGRAPRDSAAKPDTSTSADFDDAIPY